MQTGMGGGGDLCVYVCACVRMCVCVPGVGGACMWWWMVGWVGGSKEGGQMGL